MNNIKISIIGLGYVGLPLAVAFAKVFQTTGFDISTSRVEEVNSAIDKTLEISTEDLKTAIESHGFRASQDLNDIKHSNVFIYFLCNRAVSNQSTKPNILFPPTRHC